LRRALVLALLLAACGDLDPEVGEDQAAVGQACDPADSDPGTPVTFDQVRTLILSRRCGCHTIPGGLGQVVGGLDLSARDAVLAGGRHQKSGGAKVVDPGNPCDSLLVQKTGDAPPFGFRMPLSGPPLSDEDRQLITDWIAEGAPP
jgi:hypothetical protein